MTKTAQITDEFVKIIASLTEENVLPGEEVKMDAAINCHRNLCNFTFFQKDK